MKQQKKKQSNRTKSAAGKKQRSKSEKNGGDSDNKRSPKEICKVIIKSGCAVLVLYSIFYAIRFPRNLGSYLPGLMGVVLFSLTVSYDRIMEISRKGVLKWIRLSITTLAGLFFTGFFIMCIAIQVHAQQPPEKDADAIIVLGAGLIGDRVSGTLALRLNTAADYLEENPDTVAVVSGGQGEDEWISEALAMKRYLMAKGIEDQRILMEDKSTSTKENFAFSKQVLDDHFEKNDYSIIYVTNDFHLIRAGFFARQEGLTGEGLGSPTIYYMIPSQYSREYCALLYYGMESVLSR